MVGLCILLYYGSATEFSYRALGLEYDFGSVEAGGGLFFFLLAVLLIYLIRTAPLTLSR